MCSSLKMPVPLKHSAFVPRAPAGVTLPLTCSSQLPRRSLSQSPPPRPLTPPLPLHVTDFLTGVARDELVGSASMSLRFRNDGVPPRFATSQAYARWCIAPAMRTVRCVHAAAFGKVHARRALAVHGARGVAHAERDPGAAPTDDARQQPTPACHADVSLDTSE